MPCAALRRLDESALDQRKRVVDAAAPIHHDHGVARQAHLRARAGGGEAHRLLAVERQPVSTHGVDLQRQRQRQPKLRRAVGGRTGPLGAQRRYRLGLVAAAAGHRGLHVRQGEQNALPALRVGGVLGDLKQRIGQAALRDAQAGRRMFAARFAA